MLHSFNAIFSNNILGVSIFSCFFAQALKILFYYIKERKFDFTRLIGSGGMPSSHSSFVSTLTTMVGMKCGFDSAIFAIALVFTMIVMYDASGVRKAVGEQAKILNNIRDKMEKNENNFDKELKELVGHTKPEVLVGTILGIGIGILFSL